MGLLGHIPRIANPIGALRRVGGEQESAEDLALGDGVFFGGENALFEQLIQLAKRVRQRVASLNRDREGHVRRDHEVGFQLIDLDPIPRDNSWSTARPRGAGVRLHAEGAGMAKASP